MKQKELLATAGFYLMLIPSVLGLGQVAGKLVIIVPIGESNSTRYGLVNNGNETITVRLRAEGDAAEFLTFQENVTLPPKKVTFVNIIASIPKDYDISLGGNITGYLYALEEGEPGQVTINVQAKKSISILISGVSRTEITEVTEEESPITGLISLVATYWPVAVVAILLTGVIMFLRNYSFALIKKR